MAARSADKKSARNRRRAGGVPVDHWTHKARPLRLGDERFRITVLHGPGGRAGSDPITDQVTGLSWDDVTAQLTGSVTLTVPPDHAHINARDQIRVEWTPTLTGAWRRLWTMKVSAPDKSLAAAQWTLGTDTTLTEARKSRDNYRFKRDKHHPRGWTADEVARFVAAKVRMPVGRLTKCTHRITNLIQKNADPIDVIIKAYRAERRATGRKFFLRWDGALNIEPLRRPAHLLDVAGAIIDASYKAQLKDSFATTLTVTASAKARDDHTKKGKRRHTKHRRRKILVRVTSPSGVKTYGYVHRTVHAPDATTEAQARAYGKRMLSRGMRPDQTLTVTVPLMPTLRRGDAFRLRWKSEGLTQIVFVSQATHSVSPGASTTQITARFDDPYVDTKADKAAERRRTKARQRGRPGGGGDSAPSGPTSRRGHRRRSG